jgi:hypothetical protein
MSDETCLIKFFKYYDIQNRGEIALDDFIKAMEKIGLQVFSRDVRGIYEFTRLYRIFKMYSMPMMLIVMGI